AESPCRQPDAESQNGRNDQAREREKDLAAERAEEGHFVCFQGKRNQLTKLEVLGYLIHVRVVS
ncbi:MAG: hypothetical protein ACKO9H_17475, partial [Planctomycetota bacterium]